MWRVSNHGFPQTICPEGKQTAGVSNFRALHVDNLSRASKIATTVILFEAFQLGPAPNPPT